MKISVVGLGKLGSPLAAVLASKGHQVVGVDLNPAFVNKINSGIAPVPEPHLQELITQYRANLQATISYQDAILASDVTFVIVPTPSEKSGLFTNRYLLHALEQIGHALALKSSYHLVVITSTVTPGSSQGEIWKTLESASKRSIGSNLGLCYNPEFIALGSVIRNMLHPDMILIGESDKKAGDILEEIHKTCCENEAPIRRMNLVNAEIAKISINTYVTTKISYANMLSDLCEHIPGSDVNVITDAIGLDARIGTKYLKPAVAFGGPCFPRDNIALAALAKQVGARADLAEATQNINTYQNERLLNQIERLGPGLRIGILGLSYKPGTYVVEESQGIRLANLLATQKRSVSVFDPMAIEEARKILHPDINISSSVADCLSQSDLLVILIPWPEFLKEITPSALIELGTEKTIIDCWRLLSREKYDNVCHLIYMGCGDATPAPSYATMC